MSATLHVNVQNSIQTKPLIEAAAAGWKARYATGPAERIIAWDGPTWAGEFVSRTTGGVIANYLDGGRRCFCVEDMVATARTWYSQVPFGGPGRLPFRRAA